MTRAKASLARLRLHQLQQGASRREHQSDVAADVSKRDDNSCSHAKKKPARASSSGSAKDPPEDEDNDPLGHFWRTRSRQFPAHRPAWKKGRKARGASSDEGGLSEVEWCSGSGSYECELDLQYCLGADKAKMLTAALLLIFSPQEGLSIADEAVKY